jgi:hypothetical protein
MWIKRTPEEMVKWQTNAEREAISHGRLIGGIVWVLVSILGATGWFIFSNGGSGLAVQREVTGSFLLRLPMFGLLAAPFAYWIFRRESKKELARIICRTVCPQCDTAGSGNAGSTCKCGSSFVRSSTMKWVEKKLFGTHYKTLAPPPLAVLYS